MMSRQRAIQVVCLAGVVICWAGTGWLGARIESERGMLKLGYGGEGGGAGPRVAVTTVTSAAMGSFRGLAVDVLWYRLNRLKDEGKYQEANQLSEWICTLQPTFPRVWYFHAWNMAYNISVATYTPQERWDWVAKGIALLRDKGIPQNPKSVSLYKELGWIFFHKIGGYSDDMHWHYKRELAREWQEVLGSGVEGATVEQAVAEIGAIAGSPGTAERLRTERPGAAKWLDRLVAIGYSEAENEAWLRRIGRMNMIGAPLDSRYFQELMAARPELFDRKLVELMRRAEGDAGWGELMAYMRKRVLRETYRMDAGLMAELMKGQAEGGYGFGPVDWRHSGAHSLYWTVMGTKVAAEAANKKDIDLLNTYRSCIHSLQQLTDSGRVNYDPATGYIDLLPDPRFIPAYERAYKLAIEDMQKQGYGGTTEERYDAGFENFLRKAVAWSYLYGSEEQARGYYKRLRELALGAQRKPGGLTAAQHDPAKYSVPMEEMVLEEVRESMEQSAYSRQFVDAMLERAFLQGLANGREDVYGHFAGLARAAHKRNQENSVASAYNAQGRLAMLPFDQIVAESYLGLIQSPALDIRLRSRVWYNTAEGLRSRVYGRMREKVAVQCQERGVDMERAFPAPAGAEGAGRGLRGGGGEAEGGRGDGPRIERQ